MWTVTRPARSTQWTYARCISRVRDGALKARLESIEGAVCAASEQFEQAALNGTISDVTTAVAVGPVTRDELSDVYNLRLARAKAPGRIVYDEIIASATNGRCPLCGHRQVASLDHFLPKALYPALSVTPLNLVPACSDCNKAKLDHSPETAAEVTMHPYFDDVESDPWLRAEVLQTAPASLRFGVDAPPEWSPTVAARVLNHFSILRLSALYSAQAAEELLNIRHGLETVHASAGEPGVADHLAAMAESRAVARLNSWQTAAYTAMAESPWFCSGGFR